MRKLDSGRSLELQKTAVENPIRGADAKLAVVKHIDPCEVVAPLYTDCPQACSMAAQVSMDVMLTPKMPCRLMFCPVWKRFRIGVLVGRMVCSNLLLSFCMPKAAPCWVPV